MSDGAVTAEVSGGVVTGDYNYRWRDNSVSSSLTNISVGWYSLTVQDLNGCIVQDSIKVNPQNASCLLIPNAISPNGDFVNDVWNIGNIHLYPNAEVKIFNRWGNSVWVSEKGYPRPWDGTSRGRDLPIDSYHYIIVLNNGDRPIMGTITIVK
jgi:gliding motility-associated-like protein